MDLLIPILVTLGWLALTAGVSFLVWTSGGPGSGTMSGGPAGAEPGNYDDEV